MTITDTDSALLNKDEIDDFATELQELDRTPIELANQMRDWGDHRSLQTILKSIQRMTSGSTAVSGEMRVIVNMMLYQQHLDEKKYASLNWNSLPNGCISTTVNEFIVSLYPQTKARWLISIVHKNGYSHPWPSWQNNIEQAKRKALICLNDAIRHVFEYERENRIGRIE